MFKRATWMSVGFGLGVATTVTAVRKVRERIDRYQPDAVVERVTDSVQSLRDQLAAAVADGKAAARERESELRARRPRRGSSAGPPRDVPLDVTSDPPGE